MSDGRLLLTTVTVQVVMQIVQSCRKYFNLFTRSHTAAFDQLRVV